MRFAKEVIWQPCVALCHHCPTKAFECWELSANHGLGRYPSMYHPMWPSLLRAKLDGEMASHKTCKYLFHGGEPHLQWFWKDLGALFVWFVRLYPCFLLCIRGLGKKCSLSLSRDIFFLNSFFKSSWSIAFPWRSIDVLMLNPLSCKWLTFYNLCTFNMALLCRVSHYFQLSLNHGIQLTSLNPLSFFNPWQGIKRELLLLKRISNPWQKNALLCYIYQSNSSSNFGQILILSRLIGSLKHFA